MDRRQFLKRFGLVLVAPTMAVKSVMAPAAYTPPKTERIEINTDGLEPELEEFMWEILRKIRIRAAENGGDYLLGA